MRYLDLIAERPLVWSLFAVYAIVTVYLAWRGAKKTDDITSFSIGKGDLSPLVVGVTLASSIASTATFVINPGFVYVHGVSALIHLGGSVSLGIIVGLVAMSVGFRRIGARTRAITLPQWIGERYGSRGLATLFAGINLLSIAFVVLILGSLSIVMQQTLGLTNVESLIFVTVFVFGYVFLGGAYAHAYTNTLQGVIMFVVAVIIIASGLHWFSGGVGEVASELAAIDPNLTRAINPASNLFGSFFAVYVSGFVIGFALVCQPHIMTKALFVRSDREVWKYLAVAIAIGITFSGLLLVGIYARLGDIPAQAFLDPATGAFRQDQVMTAYLTHTFSPTVLAFVAVALLAAGMSTLDGILVALSSIAANDLFLNLAERRWLRHAPAHVKARVAHRVSQGILVAMGAVSFAIALSPPRLLGIFGQVGVYGIVAASAVPILIGIVVPSAGKRTALAAAVTGVAVHLVLYFAGVSANPGVTATYAILASAAMALPAVVRATRRRQSTATAHLGLSSQGAR